MLVLSMNCLNWIVKKENFTSTFGMYFSCFRPFWVWGVTGREGASRLPVGVLLSPIYNRVTRSTRTRQEQSKERLRGFGAREGRIERQMSFRAFSRLLCSIQDQWWGVCLVVKILLLFILRSSMSGTYWRVATMSKRYLDFKKKKKKKNQVRIGYGFWKCLTSTYVQHMLDAGTWPK